MKKRARIILLLLVVLLLGGLAWLVFTVQEAAGIDPKVLAAVRGSSISAEDIKTFREMGTNIVPSLRIMIRTYDSPLRIKLRQIAVKLHLAKPPAYTPAELHWAAKTICAVLDGDVRTQLVPDWIYLVERGDKQDQYDAFSAQLLAVGPEAVQPLLDALNSRNPHVREFAAGAIRIPSRADVIIPALLPKLKDPDDVVRGVTMLTLVHLRPDPETVVPLFAAALSDPSALVRCDACNALRSLAPYSKLAVPDLVKCLKDPDPNVRKLAADALLLIDNDAAAKAGVK